MTSHISFSHFEFPQRGWNKRFILASTVRSRAYSTELNGLIKLADESSDRASVDRIIVLSCCEMQMNYCCYEQSSKICEKLLCQRMKVKVWITGTLNEDAVTKMIEAAKKVLWRDISFWRKFHESFCKKLDKRDLCHHHLRYLGKLVRR